MHTVGVNLIACQVNEVGGKDVNIHDIYSVMVNGKGVIVNAYIKLGGSDEYEYMKKAEGWLLSDEEETAFREELKKLGMEY